ncbi:MAG TPA: ATP-binding protein [Gaiellaceae bacterium]|nr:ATP-binding protein [Gaiellaceae bacterium]
MRARRPQLTAAVRFVTDLNGRITDVSKGTGELLAIDDHRLIGKPLAAYVVGDGRRDFRALLLDLSRGVGPVGTLLRLQRRDGVQVEVEVEAVSDASGTRLEWLFATDGPDVEEETVTENAGLGPRPMRRLLARLPLGVVSVDQDLVVDYVNPAARVFLGGVPLGHVLPDVLPGFSLRTYASRLFTPAPPPKRVVETARGRLLELEGVVGGHDSALLLLYDVTAEERRRRAEQDFVTNAAHELRTPIAAIAGALDALQAGADDATADRELFLGHIRRESDRLARLVAALLLLARIQTGQDTPSLELVQIAPVLDDVATALEPREGVGVHVDCDARVAALADVDLLRQAVWNVAANAAKHTDEGEIRLVGRDLGRVAEIEVRDTGSGMSEETLGRAHDRFYRAQRGPGDGFGLGLPISIAIAGALGGKLIVESELGAGTRVRVHLPSARVVA